MKKSSFRTRLKFLRMTAKRAMQTYLILPALENPQIFSGRLYFLLTNDSFYFFTKYGSK